MNRIFLSALAGLALIASPGLAADYAVGYPERTAIDQCLDGADLVIITVEEDRVTPVDEVQLRAGDRLFLCVQEGDASAAMEAMRQGDGSRFAALWAQAHAPEPVAPAPTPQPTPVNPGETCVTIPGEPIKEKQPKYKTVCTIFGCFDIFVGYEWVVVGHEPDETVCTPN